MIDIKSILTGAGGLAIGLAIGALVMWGIDRVKVSDALKEAANAKLEKANVVTLLDAALVREQKYISTLEDTLLIVEVLKKYQSIDQETRKEIDSIKEVYVDGKPTKESIQRFRDLLVKASGKEEVVELPSTGATTDVVTMAANIEDISDKLFIDAMNIFFGVEQ